ncbi:MAG TPA: BTAD domain-containing putative transcriptional regulator [Polyangiaceae bacterium]|nr:BTAD domain-containing putative transcriptional regulator [Polyangiaceae bacterium]
MFDRRRILRLAEHYRAGSRFHQAIREYRKVVELEPADLGALHAIADAEQRAGDAAAAAETFATIADRLIAKGWKLAAIHRYRRLLDLANSLPASGRRRVAAEKIDRLRKELSDNRATLAHYDEAAVALEKNGRDEDVADVLGKMIALEPDNPVFHARRAETLCRLGRVEDALPVFRSAAAVLTELERPSDVLRVLERILHFRADRDDSRLAARLYLERGGAEDPLRALAKLQPCIAADPEDLDALLLLARAFDSMKQPERATQVRIAIARVAARDGESELVRDLLTVLKRAAPNDSVVKRLSGKAKRGELSAGSNPMRDSFISVTEEDLVSIEGAVAESKTVSETSVVDTLSVEELDDVFLTPVISRTARRALDDADAFSALRLHAKAAYVLRVAIEEDPLSTELREALRAALKAAGDDAGFVDATVVAAELYRQRGYEERASALVDEALAVDPRNAAARALSAALGRRRGSDAPRRARR